MIAQIGTWACLEGHIVSTSASLSMQVLAKVVVGRLDLFVDVGSDARVVVLASVETEVSMRLVHMIDVVLLLLVHLTRMLVLKDFRQDTLCVGRLACVVLVSI